MSKIYAELNDYKNAYEYQLQTKSLSDSLLAEERDSKALMMETKFRTAEKEKQLAVQELEINKKTNICGHLSSPRWSFWAAACIPFLLPQQKKTFGAA
ncbi:hypothetical protein LDL59_08325 [Kaistella anthropi]|nr:hypothetical protein [Kaistella anthropi]